jgi:hypothetical protein
LGKFHSAVSVVNGAALVSVAVRGGVLFKDGVSAAVVFYAHLRSHGKRLLPSLRPSVCPHVRAAPTGRISIKFESRVLHENLSRKSKYDSNQARMWENQIDEDQVRYIVACDFKPL